MTPVGVQKRANRVSVFLTPKGSPIIARGFNPWSGWSGQLIEEAPMATELRDALDDAIRDELDAALSRIAHCVNQLSEEQVWHRPPHGLNAIGNLLLHLAGNVKQMIADNLAGAPDTRNRP